MMSSRGLQSICPVSKSFNALPTAYAGAQVVSRRHAGTIANFKIPTINNEPNVSIKLGDVKRAQGANVSL
jgi:1-pyrroline-5-carboxylate dehydrogenase